MGGSGERIGLLAALPQECAGVLSWPGWVRQECEKGVRLYELKTPKRELRLAVGGMGEAQAIETLRILLEGFQALRVVCLGFAGALEPELDVGDVAWISRVLKLTQAGTLLEGPSLEGPPRGSGLASATVVSLPGFLSKEKLREALRGWQPPLLVDLESYALAQEATRRRVGFWGIRAVSDEACLDAGPRVAGWVDKDYKMQPLRVIVSMIRKPSDLALMLRLFRRARKASRSLGRELGRLFLQG